MATMDVPTAEDVYGSEKDLIIRGVDRSARLWQEARCDCEPGPPRDGRAGLSSKAAAPMGCDGARLQCGRGLTCARHRVNAGECNACFNCRPRPAVHSVSRARPRVAYYLPNQGPVWFPRKMFFELKSY